MNAVKYYRPFQTREQALEEFFERMENELLEEFYKKYHRDRGIVIKDEMVPGHARLKEYAYDRWDSYNQFGYEEFEKEFGI